MSSLNEYVEREAERLVAEALANRSTELFFDFLRIERLPANISQLTQLKMLSLKNCRQLRDASLIEALTNLETLELSGCEVLSTLPPLGNLQKLQRANLSRCDELTDLFPFVELKKLQHLDLRGCNLITDLTLIAQLAGLQQLDLTGCTQVTDLTPIAQLTGLQQLDLSWCEQVTDLAPIAQLTSLQQLDLSGCTRVTDLTPIANLPGLQQLDLSECEQVTDLTPIAQFASLQQLDLSGCTQVTDLTPIARLTGLQQFNLSVCEQVTDLTPITRLTRLRRLDLGGCEQVTDLTLIAQLMSLQQLDLRWCEHVTDLTPTAQLTSLQQLHLSGCSQVTDLTPIAQLASLQQLDLSWCEQITDLTSITQLISLQQLDLNRCTQVTDLTPITQLMSLQQLDLSGCEQVTDLTPISQLMSLQQLDLSGCEQVTDLTPISQLTSLQRLALSGCTQVTDLTPITQLASLQRLDLSGCTQVTDLTPISQLTGLQQLDLSGCTQITDLTPISQLTGLQQLDLSCTGIHSNRLDDLQCYPKLERLTCNIPFPCFPGNSPINKLPYLHSLVTEKLLDAPQELAYAEYRDYHSGRPCLDRVLAWQKEILATGEACNSEIKIFVLGNGRVGKTQICRRLQEQDFDVRVASTHGINLGRFPLVFDDNDQPLLFGNLWDFGGQDVYLGTHSLFLDERAVYVIVWTPEHENENTFSENGIPMQNRPLVYWLEYVRSLAGRDAPVIVVQSQCDRESEVREAQIPGEHGFTRLQRTACSAKKRDGMERFVPELKAAARLLQERHSAVRLPQSWVKVAEQLRGLHDQGQKTIDWSSYVELCVAANPQAVPHASIAYLHRSGQVFWRTGVFDEQVVLDQAWALSGIYAVLDRATTLPIIRGQRGIFTKELLAALVWTQYSPEEQSLFLSMMQQCGTCFEVTSGTYIAPGLLPSQATVSAEIEQIWRDQTPNARAHLEYTFLHEGVLRAVLCAIGKQAGKLGVYWDSGIAYYDGKAKGPVSISAEYQVSDAACAAGRIVVEAGGSGAAEVVAHLIDSIQKIRIGQPPEIKWQIGEARKVSDHESERPGGEAERMLFEIQPAAVPRTDKRPLVHFSYAWGGQSDDVADKLEKTLETTGHEVRRDKSSMRRGDWISLFMREIGQAEIILILLSNKYTQSHYCMREMLYLWQSSLGDKREMLDRVVPIWLDDCKIHEAKDRMEIVRYWHDKKRELEKSTEGLPPLSWGDSTREQLLLIQDFEHRSADMLAWVSDVLMPQGKEILAGDFSGVLEMLEGKTKR